MMLCPLLESPLKLSALDGESRNPYIHAVQTPEALRMSAQLLESGKVGSKTEFLQCKELVIKNVGLCICMFL